MLLLKSIVRYDYLWNRVRVQGGAYGCSAAFLKNGNMYFASYRDPNLKETLKVYDELSDYVKKFNADKRELTKYIIGTISDLDAPLTPSMKGQVATAMYISGTKYEDIQRERNQVLEAKVKDISNLSIIISEVLKENNICVLGSEEKIKNNKDVFNKIIEVIE